MLKASADCTINVSTKVQAFCVCAAIVHCERVSRIPTTLHRVILSQLPPLETCLGLALEQ